VIQVEMIKDSVSESSVRLCTMRLTYPRIIHSHVLLHRDRVRTVKSQGVEAGLFVPLKFKATDGGDDISEPVKACKIWSDAYKAVLECCNQLQSIGTSERLTRVLLQPFQYVTVLMTATEWQHFISIIKNIEEYHAVLLANTINAVLHESIPELIQPGHWHLPFISKDELNLGLDYVKKLSASRCVQFGRDLKSYSTKSYSDLVTRKDWVHLEHVCTPSLTPASYCGPLKGWTTFRSQIPLEYWRS
jgi:hypothetical protein